MQYLCVYTQKSPIFEAWGIISIQENLPLRSSDERPLWHGHRQAEERPLSVSPRSVLMSPENKSLSGSPRQPLTSSLLSELCLNQNVTSMEPQQHERFVFSTGRTLWTHHFAPMLVVSSFLLLLLDRIPLQGWTPICSSVFQLMGIQVVFHFKRL